MNHRICFSYGDDEYLPIFTILGANLKQKNLFYCESTKTIKNGDYTIVSGRVINSIKPIEFFITYNNESFLRGFLYIKGKEYPILEHKVYASMQIESFAYDNISILRLPNSFAEGNYF